MNELVSVLGILSTLLLCVFMCLVSVSSVKQRKEIVKILNMLNDIMDNNPKDQATDMFRNIDGLFSNKVNFFDDIKKR